MADPTRIQLTPVDVEKGYGQWGTGTYDEKGNLIKVDFTVQRQSSSDRFRETYSGFKQDSVYEIEINIPTFPEVFKSSATGKQLAPTDANGFPVERQANYPFKDIGQLPLYFELVAP